ncbi:salivary antigen-5 isoform X1 [Chironomus tepperi]|uniref:salivary antigen-5 isoform X1 n=1 Tax=Chironomus tepperi TaxID=113505 RepID=UPI00391F5B85
MKSMNNNCWRHLLLKIFIIHHVVSMVNCVCRNGRILKQGITDEERKLILEEHNFLRQTVATGHVQGQPAAQNMQEMRWDDELAVRAQMWANVCTFAHDPSRYLDRFIMGQNVGLLWSTIPLADDDGDFPSRVRNWFNEVQKYAWGAKWSVKTGHYSQLVWGDTNLVGCGFTYYQDTNNGLFNKIYVCNYGPGGNVLGAKPYQIGYPKCRNYGMSDSSKYPGLCKHQNGEEVVVNTGNEYVTLELNSINTQRKNSAAHYTYKTYNTEYDNKKMLGSSSSTSNSVPFYVNQHQRTQNYNSINNNIKIANNELHSFVKRQQHSSYHHQQQYDSNQASSSFPSSVSVVVGQRQSNFQQQNQQTTPFLQAYQQHIQQNMEKRPIDNNNPFQTYRWDQLFKNYV